jgi:hypothetical protein
MGLRGRRVCGLNCRRGKKKRQATGGHFAKWQAAFRCDSKNVKFLLLDRSIPYPPATPRGWQRGWLQCCWASGLELLVKTHSIFSQNNISFSITEITQSVQRRAVSLMTGFRFPVETTDFPFLPGVWGRPNLLHMDTGEFSPGIKQLGLEANHSPPHSAEVKIVEAIPPLPHTSS